MITVRRVFRCLGVPALVACSVAVGTFIIGSQPAAADSSVGGPITTDTVWGPGGSPYIVIADIIVSGTDGADQVTTLTIEPGTVVKFHSNRGLRIGDGTIPGRLIAQGTADARITFTGLDTQPGSWKGIVFDPGAGGGSMLDYVTVQYGGRNSGADIQINNASPTVSNSDILWSDYSGILCSGAGARPTITCNQIRDSRYGISTQAGADPVIRYNTIIKNSEYAVYNTTAGQTVIAERNWWGSPSGPNTSGSGPNRIGGEVDFDPWLAAQPSCPIPQWPSAGAVSGGILVFLALKAFTRRRAFKPPAWG